MTKESTWVYQATSDDDRGAQIDLIIDRADHCINLCEIKFSSEQFTIDKSYAEQLQSKKTIFREKTKSKKSLFLTLITPYGVKKNAAGLGVVDIELTMDDLFR
ncbi:MAG: ATPase [Chlamydiae bacterium]|nr:ATPase [Chlamydiota bacterium]